MEEGIKGMRPIILIGPSQRAYAKRMIDEAPQGWIMRLQEPKRSTLQNARLWACLADVSKQVQWHGQWLTDHEWKDVFTAALKGQKAVHGIEGGLVFIGSSTSKMTVSECNDLLSLMDAFAANHGVVWSEP